MSGSVRKGVAVGIATALGDDDYSTARTARTGISWRAAADPRRLMAELAGKDTGLCRGRGGSMHIVDRDRRLMTATGIVGGTIPLALGTALVARESRQCRRGLFRRRRLQHRQLPRVPQHGLAVEAAGRAGVREQRLCRVHADVRPHRGEPRLRARRALRHSGPRSSTATTRWPCWRPARAAVARARDGGGPTIVECLTYRLRGHYVGDPASYRKADEVAEWRDKDPIRRFAGCAAAARHDHARARSEAMASAAQRARRGCRSVHDGQPLARAGVRRRLRLRVRESAMTRNALRRRPAPRHRARDGARPARHRARRGRRRRRPVRGHRRAASSGSATAASSTRRSARTASWGWRPAPRSPASGRSSRSCSSTSSRWR